MACLLPCSCLEKAPKQGIPRLSYIYVGWLSGIASGRAYFAFSCTFQGISRFIYATYLAIAIPFLVLLGLAFAGFILFAARKHPFEELKTFWFVCTMAILDISYIG